MAKPESQMKHVQPIPEFPATDAERAHKVGLAYTLGAFMFWGLVPIYFKQVTAVPPLEVLAHRILWSVVILSVMMATGGRLLKALTVLKDFRTWLVLSLTTLLVGINWFIFIWAVNTNNVLQASLGYYINPLVNILLAVIFLRERLSRRGLVAVGLALIGVAFQSFQGTGFPWISLVLAFSFGFYGLLRKTAKIDAVAGLTVETTLLLPWALGYVIWAAMQNTGHFLAGSTPLSLLLPFAGVVTTVPLICFTRGARRLPYSTVGFIQYLAPSLQFLLAVVVYGESFRWHNAVTFGCIWTALGIYSVELWQARNARKRIT